MPLNVAGPGVPDEPESGKPSVTTRAHPSSAAALGCARVVTLGFPDSGSSGTPGPATFSGMDLEAAAQALAAVLLEESADVLTVYDPVGGYGHPDHVRVHDAGVRAAEI